MPTYSSGPDYYTDLHTGVVAAINASWPEISVIMLEEQSELINWSNVVEFWQKGISSLYSPPYCVLQFGDEMRDQGWGLGNIYYRMPVNIWYITNVGSTLGYSGSGANTNIVAHVMQRLSTLRDNLIRNDNMYNGFQTIDYPEIRIDNEVSYSFRIAESAMHGGVLEFQPLIGKPYYAG